jgi:hypothetical protein
LNFVISFSRKLTRYAGCLVARLAFESRYSAARGLFWNAGSRFGDQDFFAVRPILEHLLPLLAQNGHDAMSDLSTQFASKQTSPDGNGLARPAESGLIRVGNNPI